jgi:hypothetical protein
MSLTRRAPSLRWGLATLGQGLIPALRPLGREGTLGALRLPDPSPAFPHRGSLKHFCVRRLPSSPTPEVSGKADLSRFSFDSIGFLHGIAVSQGESAISNQIPSDLGKIPSDLGKETLTNRSPSAR